MTHFQMNRWRALQDDDSDEYDDTSDDFTEDDIVKLSRIVETVPYFQKLKDLLEKLYEKLNANLDGPISQSNQETNATSSYNNHTS